MVPHIRLEELLTRIVEDPNDEEGEVRIAVTAVPDADKGERLIVLHKPLSKSPDEILKRLSEAGIPNLWLPSADSFIEVPEIPVLGTGKLDLRALKQLALEKTANMPTRPRRPTRRLEASRLFLRQTDFFGFFGRTPQKSPRAKRTRGGCREKRDMQSIPPPLLPSDSFTPDAGPKTPEAFRRATFFGSTPNNSVSRNNVRIGQRFSS